MNLSSLAAVFDQAGLECLHDRSMDVLAAKCPVCLDRTAPTQLPLEVATNGKVPRFRCLNGCDDAAIRIALPALDPQKPKPTSDSFDSDQWAQLIADALQRDPAPAIPLPFPKLTDALDGGLRAGEVCVVAGYTSHGKSVWLDMMADTAAANGRRVHLYLTEMTAVARGMRLLARRANVPLRALKRRNLSNDQMKRVLDELKQLPYGCSIVAGWNIETVVKHVTANKWDMAVVDLIHGFHYTDERELSKTSSALVAAAKSWQPGTTLVAAAHLNDGQMRDARSPRRPRPGLHSIKGSSSLKQDPDVVMFVWRQDTDDGVPTDDGEIWIAKNRDGDFAAMDVLLNGPKMRFEERTTPLRSVA